MSNRAPLVKNIKLLQRIALFLLTGFSLLVFVFALFSGAETYGSGASSLLQNSPNTLPWLILLLLSILSWKKRKWGGLLVLAFGLIATWFFNFRGQNFFLLTFIICLSISFLGFLIWICQSLIDTTEKQNQRP